MESFDEIHNSLEKRQKHLNEVEAALGEFKQAAKDDKPLLEKVERAANDVTGAIIMDEMKRAVEDAHKAAEEKPEQ